MKGLTTNTPNLHALSDVALRRSIYVTVLLATLLPPLVGGSLMAFIGFYPLPEFFLIFTSYSGWYILIVLIGVLSLVPRWYRFIVGLTQTEHTTAQAQAEQTFSHLPRWMFLAVMVYSMIGVFLADVSLQSLGYGQYMPADHLYHQMGLITVILLSFSPIFFYLMDCLGRYLGPRGVRIIAIPLWKKWLVLGSVAPILINSLLIVYHFKRTGFFEVEVVVLWLALLMLALGGTWISWRSFKQGLAPLESFLLSSQATSLRDQASVSPPLSLDELGVLTAQLGSLVSHQAQLSNDLRQAKVLADSLVDSAAALVVVLDAEGRIQRFNRACEVLTQYSFHEMEGQFVWDKLLTKEEKGLVYEQAFKLLVQNPQIEKASYLNYWVAKDGSKYLIRWFNSLILDENGAVDFIVSVGIDVTKQQETELALQENEKRLKEALHMAQIGNWELDIVSGGLCWSDEIFNLFEIDQKQFSASYSAFLQIIHPEDRGKVDQAYTDSVRTQQPYEIAHRLQMPDGRIKWVNERCSTFYDDQGKPIRSIGTVQDITERMKAEETINLYASVFERSGEAIVITDTHNKILAVNDAFCMLTGYSRQDVVGQNPSVLASGKSTKEEYLVLWKELNENSFWQGEKTNRHKDGHEYVVWLSISAIRNAQNRVTHYVASFTDITEHKRAADKIHYLAHHDTLTDLLNRFTLIERLQQAINSARRNHEKVGVMFIDLDRFKVINDSLGHHVGDLLLIEVARRLKSCTRNNDIVARLGGDEFVVALNELEDTDTLFHVANKILQVLGRAYLLNQHEVHTSPSIGIAVFPEDGGDVDEIMKNADVAMYHAKSRGRNNFQFFMPSMNQANIERLELEHDLRLALEREEFMLYYQPKIDGHTQKVMGVEALIRWQHPQKGLISPATFIPMAEELGLMLPIGDWVLSKACDQLKEWQDRGLKDLQMSVNLSQRQFYRQNLSSTIVSTVEKAQINPALLELEITESMAMQDPRKTIESLQILRNLGIKLSLDDFGTGYSSLNYLKQFPINGLKLDRSYVKDIETDPSDAAICAATISLAHDLGLDVVAEGVETEKQYAYLKKLDCDKFQGYFFCRPLPAGEAEAYIRERNLSQFSQILSAKSIHVLVIDDDEWVCDFHQHILENMGHKVTTVLDPIEGLEILRKNTASFGLIMLDMLMPHLSGVDLIKSVREVDLKVPIIVVTSYQHDAVRKTLRTLEKEYNLMHGINYFILEKPLAADGIRELIKKIL